MHIICIGDSLTSGYVHRAKSHPYSKRLKTLLDQSSNRNNNEDEAQAIKLPRITKLAKGGNTSNDTYTVIQTMVGKKGNKSGGGRVIDIERQVVLWIGVNDLVKSQQKQQNQNQSTAVRGIEEEILEDEDEILVSFKNLIKLLYEKGLTSNTLTVLTLPPLNPKYNKIGSVDLKSYEISRVKFNTAIVLLGASQEFGFNVIEVDDMMLNEVEGGDGGGFYSDGLHLNAVGYDMIGEKVYKSLGYAEVESTSTV